MTYKAKAAVSSEFRTKRSAQSEQHVEFFNVKPGGRAGLKLDGTCAETRFGISEKWTSPFQSAGESVHSTTGSRGVRISGQTMDRQYSEVQCKSSGYPLQSPISPSLPPHASQCALTFLTVCT